MAMKDKRRKGQFNLELIHAILEAECRETNRNDVKWHYKLTANFPRGQPQSKSKKTAKLKDFQPQPRHTTPSLPTRFVMKIMTLKILNENE